MSDSERVTYAAARDVRRAVKAYQNGMSAQEVSDMFGVPVNIIMSEVDRQKANLEKLLKKTSPKSFRYDTGTMENAVNAVLCGTSIKEAAQIYNVPKNELKDALRDEIELETREDGNDESEAEEGEYEVQDLTMDSAKEGPTAKLIEHLGQAMYEQMNNQKSMKKMTASLKDLGVLGEEIEVTCGKFSVFGVGPKNEINKATADDLVLESLSPEKLNHYITQFMKDARKPDGNEYEVSSIRSLFQSFDRYLRDNDYQWSIKQDVEFESSRSAKRAKVDKISAVRQSGKLKLNAIRGMSEYEVEVMFDCGVLGLDTPQALINTLWWNNCRFLGLRGCREHHNLKWGDFQYVTAMRDGRNSHFLHFTGPVSKKTVLSNADIWPTSDDPVDGHDPLSVYLKYREMRPKAACNKDSPFYLSPNFTLYKGSRCRTSPYDAASLPDSWFRIMPYGINAFAGMMKSMFKSAGLLVEGEDSQGEKYVVANTAVTATTSAAHVGNKVQLAPSGALRSLLKKSQNQQKTVYLSPFSRRGQEVTNNKGPARIHADFGDPSTSSGSLFETESVAELKLGEISYHIKEEPDDSYEEDEHSVGFALENVRSIRGDKNSDAVTTQFVSFGDSGDSSCNMESDWLHKTDRTPNENTKKNDKQKQIQNFGTYSNEEEVDSGKTSDVSRKRRRLMDDLDTTLETRPCFRGRHVCCLHGYEDRGTQTDASVGTKKNGGDFSKSSPNSDDNEDENGDDDNDNGSGNTDRNNIPQSGNNRSENSTDRNNDTNIDGNKASDHENKRKRQKFDDDNNEHLDYDKNMSESGNKMETNQNERFNSKSNIDESTKTLDNVNTDKKENLNMKISQVCANESANNIISSEDDSEKSPNTELNKFKEQVMNELSEIKNMLYNMNRNADNKSETGNVENKSKSDLSLQSITDQRNEDNVDEEKVVANVYDAFTSVLYKGKFFCPGLHSHCIKLTGTETWITPKQLSVMGGKASLKNWKNAVRTAGIALRTFMDAGTLDFHEHEVNCSGKCSHKTTQGGPGKYQSKINSLEKKQLGTVSQFNQTMGGSPSASARSTPNTTGSHMDDSIAKEELSAFTPLVENLSTTSPGFDVLKKATEEDRQPMFPSPTIKTEKADEEDYIRLPPLNPVVSIENPMVTSTPIINASLMSPGQPQFLGHPGMDRQPFVLVPTHPVPPPRGTPMFPGTNLKCDSSSFSSTPHAVSYLVQNGQIQGQVKQVGQHFVLQKEMTTPPPDILQVASSFPDIECIMKDSPTFWKGIQDIGLLDGVFSDIKQKLRSMKHEMVNIGITLENAAGLSSVVAGLGLQTKLKYKLANHQVASERQNQRLQMEIDELQKKVQEHQRKQDELKRKSHCFNQLMSNKRPRLDLNESPIPTPPKHVPAKHHTQKTSENGVGIALRNFEDDNLPNYAIKKQSAEEIGTKYPLKRESSEDDNNRRNYFIEKQQSTEKSSHPLFKIDSIGSQPPEDYEEVDDEKTDSGEETENENNMKINDSQLDESCEQQGVNEDDGDDNDANESSSASVNSTPVISPQKRGRGRPRKVSAVVIVPEDEET